MESNDVSKEIPDAVKHQKSDKQIEKENERLKAKLYEQEQQNKSLKIQLDAAKEQKRKPGVTQVEYDGTEKKKKIKFENRWGLSDMVIPPYTKGRIAIYKCVDGDGGKNPATGLDVEAFDRIVPGRYTFTDPFEKDAFKKKKWVENIVGAGTRMEDGQKILTDEVSDILFFRGWKHVDIQNDFTLYVFLELHPNNGSNKYRPANFPVIFQRMDIETRSRSAISATVELAFDAMKAVREMKTTEIYEYAAGVPEIQSHAGRPIHELRADLMRWAQSNPIPFFKLNKNARAGIQITILDAISFGLIEYVPSKKSWIYVETEEEISTHTSAEDPMDRLIKELENNEDWRNVIQERMNYWA